MEMLKSISLFLLVSLLGDTCAECPLEGHHVIPHEWDNTKYIVCLKGRELVLSCDERTVYNPFTQKCESSLQRSSRIPTCSFNQVETMYFPHETSCTMFYTCAYGVTNLESCPGGLEYNPNLWGCVLISDTGCTASKTTTTDLNWSRTEEITTPIEESTTSIDLPKEISQKKCHDLSQSECIEPKSTEVRNSKIQPRMVLNNLNSLAAKFSKQLSWTCPDNNLSIRIYPHETECSVFYICFGGVATAHFCDTSNGYEFDASVLNCVPTSSSGCTAAKTSTLAPTTRPPTTGPPTFSCPNDSSILTVFADQQNCNQFYTCFQGVSNTFTCKEGYEFDEKSQGCTWISANGCTASKTTLQPSTSPENGAWSTEPSTFRCPSNNHVSITVFPDGHSCNKFHVCFGGVASTFFCDPGYEFSERYLICVISTSGCTTGGTVTTSQWTTDDQWGSSTTPWNPSTTPWDSSTTPWNPNTTPWYPNSTSDWSWYPSTTTEDSWYPSSTTDGSWYPSSTTDGSWYPSSTTEDSWYPSSTTEDSWYPSSTTDGSWYPSSTTDGSWYPSTTTEDSWYPSSTTDGSWYPSSTTEDSGYPSSTTDVSWYPSTTTEDSWYPSSTTDGSWYPSSTTDNPTSSTPFRCPSSDSTVTIFGDKYDCATMYLCFNGEATAWKCDAGLEFDDVYKKCVPIGAGGCASSLQGTPTPAF